MGMNLVARLVNIFERRAGQLQLSARLQRDIAVARRQRDGVAVFHDRLPAETLKTFEKLADTPGSLIGDGLKRIQLEDEFFVFGSDPPVLGRLAAFFEVFRELP